jgi:hypothetical protein
LPQKGAKGIKTADELLTGRTFQNLPALAVSIQDLPLRLRATCSAVTARLRAIYPAPTMELLVEYVPEPEMHPRISPIGANIKNE